MNATRDVDEWCLTFVLCSLNFHRSSQITVQKESCDGLPQSCPQPPETEHKTTDCACRTVSCKWEEWSSWSTTCGAGTRTRDIIGNVLVCNLIVHYKESYCILARLTSQRDIANVAFISLLYPVTGVT